MRRGVLAFCSALALSLLSAVPALAWGDDGHKIVCQIAYDALTPSARAEVDRLIAADGMFPSFPESCPWPDKLGLDPAYDAKPSWHYLNMRRDDPTVDDSDCDPERRCVLYAVSHYRAALEDKSRPDKERAQALEFLAHFIADAHQPLHVSFADGQGGNKIRVLWLSGEPTNLHFVWDFVLIETEERQEYAFLPEGERWRRYAARLESEIKASDRERFGHGTPISWAQESYDLARSPELEYASARKGDVLTLGWDYFYAARAIIDERLKAAGLRLAQVLNEALP